MFNVGIRSISLILLLASIGLAIVSCAGSGGAGGSEGRGRVTLTVTWPTSRAIPAATRSIKVVAKVLQPENGPEVGQEIVQRPANQATSTIALEDLPSVKIRLTATAYASTDGTGTVLAQGSTDIQVPENNAVSANINLADDGGGCLDPKARAFVEVSNDEGPSDGLNLGAFTASASISGVDHHTIDDQPFNVSTAASSSVNRGNLSASATTEGQGDAVFEDKITVSAPGKEGQTGQMTIVMAATPASNGGAERDIQYTYLIEGFDSGDIEIDGEFDHGTLIGDPPASGQVSSVVSFVYGQPTHVFMELRLSVDVYDVQMPLTQSATWNFVRFQGLPAGAAVHSGSCDDWFSVQ